MPLNFHCAGFISRKDQVVIQGQSLFSTDESTRETSKCIGEYILPKCSYWTRYLDPIASLSEQGVILKCLLQLFKM